MVLETSCSVLVANDAAPDRGNDLKQELEQPDEARKLAALKSVILGELNGQSVKNILMTVIRFVLPSSNHEIKKLLLIYWEILPKHGPDGKLLPEMILFCNYVRNDLNHANEYIRGITLRFLTKLKEPDLLEPLLASVRMNLENRHAYVRKNAVIAIHHIYKNNQQLIPDAPEVILEFLEKEGDATCRRNAFLMLYHCAQDVAVEWMRNHLDGVTTLSDALQMLFLELIRRVCRQNPGEKGKYMRTLVALLQSNAPAVRYEVAGTLVSLSSAPTALRSAAQTYAQLLSSQSDNNVKLIVLDRLHDLKTHHRQVLQDMVMDILRALTSHSLEIRRKTVDLVLELVSPRNIEEVVLVLKKEVMKTQSEMEDKNGEYRRMLVRAIHTCTVKFPEVASSVAHLLMDFLGDSNAASAHDVILFVRELAETFEDLRPAIVKKLFATFGIIRASRVYRTAVWIISEYCGESKEDLLQAMSTIKNALGDVPFISEKKDEEEEETSEPTPSGQSQSKRPVVLADGTYATQTAEDPLATTQAPTDPLANQPLLRVLIFKGDFYLASVVATALTKLTLKLGRVTSDPVEKNTLTAQTMSVLISMLRLGNSPLAEQKIEADSRDRIVLCLRVLGDPSSTEYHSIFVDSCRQSYHKMLTEEQAKTAALNEEERKANQSGIQADDLIHVRQLKGRRNLGVDMDLEDLDEADLNKATGVGSEKNGGGVKWIAQLTGFSDPVYAEAHVTVHQYDILLDILVINQTNDTLQNLTIELATIGDIKVCERPQPIVLGASAQQNIRASIKVSSTETGVVYGSLVYEVNGEQNVLNLNDLHVDIMDYINPAEVSDAEFRQMWAEFEWENKVAVNTSITDTREFLEHIVKVTNMGILNKQLALDSGQDSFLSANLYAKSVFGESALVNFSVEKTSSGQVTGFMRIRSRTQAIALSLGDTITLKQKSNKE